MIGDAVCTQRTPRSMPAACSLTRMMEPSHPGSALPLLRAANICLGKQSEPREDRVDASRVFAIDQGTFTLLLSWTSIKLGLISLVSTSEPDLTVELIICAIDATSKCGLFLAARDIVDPDVNFEMCLSLVARDTVCRTRPVCLLPHATQCVGHVQSVSCRTRNSGSCR